MPTTRPLSPRSTTIGKSTCESPTVRSVELGVNSSPTNRGMTSGATRMNSGRDRAEPGEDQDEERRGEAERLALRPCSSISVKTGTKAAESAASATRLRTRFGTWKAIVKAEKRPLVPK